MRRDGLVEGRHEDAALRNHLERFEDGLALAAARPSVDQEIAPTSLDEVEDRLLFIGRLEGHAEETLQRGADTTVNGLCT